MKMPKKQPKKTLNTHISVEEHAYLKREAARQSDTVAQVLRRMIRRCMLVEADALAKKRPKKRARRITQASSEFGWDWGDNGGYPSS